MSSSQGNEFKVKSSERAQVRTVPELASTVTPLPGGTIVAAGIGLAEIRGVPGCFSSRPCPHSRAGRLLASGRPVNPCPDSDASGGSPAGGRRRRRGRLADERGRRRRRRLGSSRHPMGADAACYRSFLCLAAARHRCCPSCWCAPPAAGPCDDRDDHWHVGPFARPGGAAGHEPVPSAEHCPMLVRLPEATGGCRPWTPRVRCRWGHARRRGGSLGYGGDLCALAERCMDTGERPAQSPASHLAWVCRWSRCRAHPVFGAQQRWRTGCQALLCTDDGRRVCCSLLRCFPPCWSSP